MAAATAGQRGRRVLVIDHNDEPGRKILISGGGRCNFTNLDAEPARYLSSNPHFAKSALSRYTATDFVALVEAHGIAWHEKTLGQLFCDGSARQIVALLMDECTRGAVDFHFGSPVTDVAGGDGSYRVTTSRGELQAKTLIIATGGPSIPKLGATGFAYELARKFGLKVVEPRPALVPLTLGGEEALFRTLSGVAAEVAAGCGGARFREAALFTHRGLSGPAILQVSSYWRRGVPVSVDFLPDSAPGWLVDAKRTRPRTTLKALLTPALPARLVDALLDRLGFPSADLGQLPDRLLVQVEEALRAWEFNPNGSEGLAKAEVTAGGISTDGLSSRTMEAPKVPGLFVVGEAVDVTGWLGGYNFQWAWASGWAAGQAV